ncbi:MAG: hypothetical protein ACM3Z4_03795 [Hyphomicrobiales bacterium]|jgi:hypothetical protein
MSDEVRNHALLDGTRNVIVPDDPRMKKPDPGFGRAACRPN